MSNKYFNHKFDHITDIRLRTTEDVDIVAEHMAFIWGESFSPGPSFKKRRESLRNIACRMGGYKDYNDFLRKRAPWDVSQADAACLALEDVFLLKINNYKDSVSLHRKEKHNDALCHLFAVVEEDVDNFDASDDMIEAALKSGLDGLKNSAEWQVLLRDYIITNIHVVVPDMHRCGVERHCTNDAVIDDLSGYGFIGDSHYELTPFSPTPEQTVTMEPGDENDFSYTIELKRKA